MKAHEYSRRDFVQISLASALGRCLPMAATLAMAASRNAPRRASSCGWPAPESDRHLGPQARPKNGGPSRRSPRRSRGYGSVSTSETRRGRQGLGIIRSMSTKEGEHAVPRSCCTPDSCRTMRWHTRHRVSVRQGLGDPDHDLPSYVNRIAPGRIRKHGAGFLGSAVRADGHFRISENPNARAILTIDYLMPTDASRRRPGSPAETAHRAAGGFAKRHGGSQPSPTAALTERPAHDDNQARGAFRLEEESPSYETRTARNRFGRGCLAGPPGCGARRVLR